MKLTVIAVLCLLLVVDGVLSGTISKKDVNPKPDDEAIYGDLEGNDPDVQKDQDYYTDEDPDPAPEEDTGDSDNEVDTKIISKPEIFRQSIPGIVTLPCQASASDPIRAWSKDGVLIFQGTVNVKDRKNLNVSNDGTLVVTLQSDDDYGKYACKLIVSQNSQPEIVHEIVKTTSPTIVAIYANDNKTNVLNPGDSLTLTCQATGFPKPRISWHKSNERLGTEGETLIIQSIRPKHSGSYRCLADNGVGKPAHSHIDINVNHPPVVSVEKYYVNSDHESDAELICEVKAYPAPVVNWQKDGQNLATKEPKIKLTRERNNERNLLIIKNIDQNDFGTYSCVASNSLGRQEKNVSLIKEPALRNFEKLLVNESTRDVILQWRVESKKPILGHELQYRKKGEQSWRTISPTVADGENDVYLIKHTLQNLEPGVYETRARSKNSHGWSQYSDIMPFEGDPTYDTPAQQRSEEISPVGESKTSSSTLLHPPIFLVTLAVFATYFRTRQ